MKKPNPFAKIAAAKGKKPAVSVTAAKPAAKKGGNPFVAGKKGVNPFAKKK